MPTHCLQLGRFGIDAITLLIDSSTVTFQLLFFVSDGVFTESASSFESMLTTRQRFSTSGQLLRENMFALVRLSSASTGL